MSASCASLQPRGVRRALGQHHVARVGGRVPDADLDFGRQVEAHLAQHRARLAHHARAVLEILVPVGRQADDRERRARAQRAADHVLAPWACSRARRGGDGAWASTGRAPHRGLAVGEQARLECRVGPRPGDDAGAVARDPLPGRGGSSSSTARCLQPVRFERCLDGGDALLDGAVRADDGLSLDTELDTELETELDTELDMTTPGVSPRVPRSAARDDERIASRRG